MFGLKEDKTLSAVKLIIIDDEFDKVWIQKNIGTFSNTGEAYTFTYSEETCDPVGSETFKLNSSDPEKHIWVDIDGTSVKFFNVEDRDYYPPDQQEIQVLVEDKECKY